MPVSTPPPCSQQLLFPTVDPTGTAAHRHLPPPPTSCPHCPISSPPPLCLHTHRPAAPLVPPPRPSLLPFAREDKPPLIQNLSRTASQPGYISSGWFCLAAALYKSNALSK